MGATTRKQTMNALERHKERNQRIGTVGAVLLVAAIGGSSSILSKPQPLAKLVCTHKIAPDESVEMTSELTVETAKTAITSQQKDCVVQRCDVDGDIFKKEESCQTATAENIASIESDAKAYESRENLKEFVLTGGLIVSILTIAVGAIVNSLRFRKEKWMEDAMRAEAGKTANAQFRAAVLADCGGDEAKAQEIIDKMERNVRRLTEPQG